MDFHVFFFYLKARDKIHVIAGFNFTLAYLPDFKHTVKVVKTFIFDDKNILKHGDYLLKNIQPMITGYKHSFIYKNPQ